MNPFSSMVMSASMACVDGLASLLATLLLLLLEHLSVVAVAVENVGLEEVTMNEPVEMMWACT